jgi:arylsulfatase A-like enzyme
MKSRQLATTLFVFGLIVTLAGCGEANNASSAADLRPNILLGSFGSEIETPNLDRLAERGVRFNDFHVSVSCSPTRSMLLSGTDNHIAGLGTMGELLAPNQIGMPGYEGRLNDRVVSLSEALKSDGYHTYMAGKWHLGHQPESLPRARGFERSFSMLLGGASAWDDRSGPRRRQAVPRLPRIPGPARPAPRTGAVAQQIPRPVRRRL